jgi:multidrug efflux pump subunit AcrB
MTYSQYSMSSNVTGIKNMEAQTLNGISVQKVYVQPDVNLDLAISQIVAATNSIRALMPAGIQPPIVVQYNASSVPVLQLSLEAARCVSTHNEAANHHPRRQRRARPSACSEKE